MRAEYNVTVREASRELNARERIKMKDLSNAVEIAKETKTGSLIITDVVDYAVLDVHNEKSQDKDYVKYILVDAAGNKYTTGSESFWRNFIDIWEELKSECPDEPISIEVMRKPSQNNEGDFLSCALI